VRRLYEVDGLFDRDFGKKHTRKDTLDVYARFGRRHKQAGNLA
jgi:hypothetical protein